MIKKSKHSELLGVGNRVVRILENASVREFVVVFYTVTALFKVDLI